jgi:pimeloyl-ACP methyl ester carboxylesterase
MYLRPTYRGPGEQPHDDRNMYADFDPEVPAVYPGYPFYRPEPVYILKHLPELRPSVLYIFGESSGFSSSEGWEEKTSNTGTGVGGSGGVKAGRVKQIVVPGTGHFVALEKVHECADSIADFLGVELKRWRDNAEAFHKSWSQKSLTEKQQIDDKWRETIDPKTRDKPSTKL